ncbi:MAG: UvrD-helicase domain-containing protein [Candidatus Cloacimonetes bacterium]|nr:UvrD-helicase domain-containing protein [Candidatus Cloacimonadota bacterium]
MKDLLSRELNAQQQLVVTTSEGPIMVLAGAGSGKTRSIIFRVAYLIKEGKIPPWNILVVTFTNKAARELKTRLENLLAFPITSLWVGTFHSICIRILRFEATHLPFGANFSIYDEDDKKSVLKKIYKAHNIDVQKVPIPRVMNSIGKYKNKLMLPEDLSKSKDEIAAYGDYYSAFLNIYQLYQQSLLLNQALDFDDILLYTAKLLQSNDAVRQKYQQMFRYVMIDEYQDTNYAQFQIVYQIARESKNICVVGDDDQAIYSWRGATIRNILEFERDYGNVTAIRLEQNYRSTNAILHFANAIIKNNKRRHPKELWSSLGDGEKPRLYAYDNETEEAEKTANQILELSREGIPLSQIAVLYRTNAQSRLFEYTFMQKKLPYSIVGSLYFYQRKEIKDFLAYLWVIANPSDNESLLRIINEPPRGIGQTSVNHLIAHANKLHIPIYSVLPVVGEVEALQNAARGKISGFYEKLQNWHQLSLSLPVLELVKTVLEDLDWIEFYRRSKDPKDIARSENLVEFVTSVSEFT